MITLKGLTFHAHHGVFDEERKNGNTFIVDISIKSNTKEAEQSDNLSETIDYGKVYLLVKKEMKVPSHLLENVAYRINNSVKNLIKKGKIKTTIYKKNPPIEGDCEYSSVTLKTKI